LKILDDAGNSVIHPSFCLPNRTFEKASKKKMIRIDRAAVTKCAREVSIVDGPHLMNVPAVYSLLGAGKKKDVDS